MNFIIFPSIRSNSSNALELNVWSEVRKLRKRSNIRSSRTRRSGRMPNSWPEDELDTTTWPGALGYSQRGGEGRHSVEMKPSRIKCEIAGNSQRRSILGVSQSLEAV
ncbi:LOW QUALITY PROTEIN: uncharacterized protein LOC26535304 [Drosophila yakuba]|uniref:Uncharacterized protein n=1 Tax=Drosophila yakuba TaxID=7245 RepID=A0A0R1DJ37_DROYA|nr:LOW QUALITY PROTEIN: uncharacterized protein LOC26535304 [Drosophila yakuba]KRJ97210.1 LOW QUALITY PROTEIN: uncharacterized protein Dyak_GE28123 [Drosophila yakuba]